MLKTIRLSEHPKFLNRPLSDKDIYSSLEELTELTLSTETFIKEHERESRELDSFESFLEKTERQFRGKDISYSTYSCYKTSLESFKISSKLPQEVVTSLEEYEDYRTIVSISLEEQKKAWLKTVIEFCQKIAKYTKEKAPKALETISKLSKKISMSAEERASRIKEYVKDNPTHIPPFQDKVLKSDKYIELFIPGGKNQRSLSELSVAMKTIANAFKPEMIVRYTTEVIKGLEDIEKSISSNSTGAEELKTIGDVFKPMKDSQVGHGVGELLSSIFSKEVLKIDPPEDVSKAVEAKDDKYKRDICLCSDWMPQSAVVYTWLDEITISKNDEGDSKDFIIQSLGFQNKLEHQNQKHENGLGFDPSAKTNQDCINIVDNIQEATKTVANLENDFKKAVDAIVSATGKLPQLLKKIDNLSHSTQQNNSSNSEDKDDLFNPPGISTANTGSDAGKDMFKQAKEHSQQGLKTLTKFVKAVQIALGKLDLVLKNFFKYVESTAILVIKLLEVQLGVGENKQVKEQEEKKVSQGEDLYSD